MFRNQYGLPETSLLFRSKNRSSRNLFSSDFIFGHHITQRSINRFNQYLKQSRNRDIENDPKLFLQLHIDNNKTTNYVKAWNKAKASLQEKALAVLKQYKMGPCRGFFRTHKNVANNLIIKLSLDTLDDKETSTLLNAEIKKYLSNIEWGKQDTFQGDYCAALYVILKEIQRVSITLACQESKVQKSQFEISSL